MVQEVYIQGLPDVIAFPDNWSQEDISEHVETDQFKREIYQQFGKIVMTNDDAEDWQITKGIKSGGAALGTGLAGSIATFGVMIGSPEIVDWSKEQLADYQMKRLVHQGTNTTLESIGSESVADFLTSPDQWDAFINWGLFNFGNAASTTLPTILAAGLSITPAAPLAIPFMLGYGAMMGAGEGFSSAIGEDLTDEEAANIALGVMIPHAALELAPGSVFIKSFKGALTSGSKFANQVIKTTKREGVKKGAGKAMATAPTFVRAMGAGFWKGAVAEGLTEGGQEGLVEGTVQTVAGNHNVFKDPAFWKQIGEAVAAGAVGGGPLTAATAGLGQMRQKRRTKELNDLMESVQAAALKEEELDSAQQEAEQEETERTEDIDIWRTPISTIVAAAKANGMDETVIQKWRDTHRAEIEQAVKDGKDVPADVLEEYPYLQEGTVEDSLDAELAAADRLAEGAPTTDQLAEAQAAYDLRGKQGQPTDERGQEAVTTPQIQEVEADLAQAQQEAQELEQIKEKARSHYSGRPFPQERDDAVNALRENVGEAAAQAYENAWNEQYELDIAKRTAENAAAASAPQASPQLAEDLRELPALGVAMPIPGVPDPSVEVNLPKVEGAGLGVQEAVAKPRTPTNAQQMGSYLLQRYPVDMEVVEGLPLSSISNIKFMEEFYPWYLANKNGLTPGARQAVDAFIKDRGMWKEAAQVRKSMQAGTLSAPDPRLFNPSYTTVERPLDTTPYKQEVYDRVYDKKLRELLAIQSAEEATAKDKAERKRIVARYKKYRKDLELTEEELIAEEIEDARVAALTPAEVLVEDKKESERILRRQNLPYERLLLARDKKKGKHSRLPAHQEKIEKLENAFDQVRAWLDTIGLKDVTLAMPWELLDPNFNTDSDSRIMGNWTRGLIEIAMNNPNRLGTAKHEVIHAMKEMGLFTKAEWGTLKRMAKGWRKLYNIDALYAEDNLTNEQLNEEAIAVAFENWTGSPSSLLPKSPVHGLFQRIKDFLQNILEAVTNQGFDTAEDIFGRIESGLVGMRPRLTKEKLELPGEKWSIGEPGTSERLKKLGNWFGASIVRTIGGYPMVMFHGTFDPANWGPLGSVIRFNRGPELGVHFGTSDQANKIQGGAVLESAARRDVRRDMEEAMGPESIAAALDTDIITPETVAINKFFNKRVDEYIAARQGFNIFPVFLHIKNPLRMPDMNKWNPSQIVKLLTEGFHTEEMTVLRLELSRKITKNNPKLDEAEVEALVEQAMADIIPVFSAEEGAVILRNLRGDKTQAQRNNIIRSHLKAKGYDGFIYKNTIEVETSERLQQFHNSYMVFDPWQVKSIYNADFGAINDAMHSRSRTSENVHNDVLPIDRHWAVQYLTDVLGKLLTRVSRHKDLDDAAKITGVDNFTWFNKIMNTSRHLADKHPGFANFWDFINRIRKDTQKTVENLLPYLTDISAIKVDKQQWLNLTRAIEAALLQGKRYRPQAFGQYADYDTEIAKARDKDGPEAQLSEDYWKGATIEIVNSQIEVDGVMVDAVGRGKGSTLVGGETIVLAGPEAKAYVQMQEMYLHLIDKVRTGSLIQSEDILNHALSFIPKGTSTFDGIPVRELEGDQTVPLVDKFGEQNMDTAGTDVELANIQSQLQTLWNMAALNLSIKPSEHAWIKLQTKYMGDPDLREIAFKYGWLIPTANTAHRDMPDYRFSTKAERLLYGLGERKTLSDKPRPTENYAAQVLFDNERAFQQSFLDLILKADEEMVVARHDAIAGGAQVPTSQFSSFDTSTFKDLTETLENMKRINRQMEQIANFKKKDFMNVIREGSHYVGVWSKKVWNQTLGQEGPSPNSAIEYQQIKFKLFDITQKQKERIVRQKMMELREKYPEEDFEIRAGASDRDATKQGLQAAQVNVDTLFSMLSASEQVAATATRKALLKILGERGIDGLLQDRRLIAGYELDISKSIEIYASGMAKLAAEMKYSHRANDAILELSGKMKVYAEKTMQYVMDPAQEARHLRLAGFIMYIGLNFSSAILQTVTIPMIGLPWMTMITGVDKAHVAAAALAKASIDIGKMFDVSSGRSWRDVFINMEKFKGTKDEKDFLMRGIENGINKAFSLVQESGIGASPHMLNIALNKHGLSVDNITQVAISGMFSTMETSSRMILSLAMYRLMQNKANLNRARAVFKDSSNILENSIRFEGRTEPNASDIALYGVEEVFQQFGKENRAMFMRGPIGASIFQFAHYSWATTELIFRLLRGAHGKEGQKAAALMLLMIFLASGARGIPGVDDIDEIMRFGIRVFGSGLDHDLSLVFKELVEEAGLPGHIADFLEKGAITTYTGIDVQRRLAITLPGIPLIKAVAGMRGDIYDTMGVPGSLIFGNPRDAFQLWKDGRGGEAIMRILPVALRNAAESVYMGRYGIKSLSGHQLLTPEEVDIMDQAKKFFGFNSTKLGKARELEFVRQSLIRANSSYQNRVTKQLTNLNVDLVYAIQAGNVAEVVDIRADMNAIMAEVFEHNQTARPEHIINPRIRTITRATRDRLSPGTGRRMPRRLRRQMQRIEARYNKVLDR